MLLVSGVNDGVAGIAALLEPLLALWTLDLVSACSFGLVNFDFTGW